MKVIKMTKLSGILSIVICLLQLHISAQTNNKLIHVLIIDGYSNHDWKQTTALTKSILEESKLFKVDVSTAPATTYDDTLATWNPVFDGYDVLIQNTNNIQNKTFHWPRRVEEKLERFVHSGGGLYVLHSANNAFSHWKQYDTIMGLGWRPKETGFALEIDSNKNILRIPPGEGKSYAFDTANRKTWPVEWVVQYGKGRVYNSSMGHL